MSRTVRRGFKGQPLRDGQWAKRCPEADCDWCVIGKSKKVFRRNERHRVKIGMKREF